MTFLQLCKRLRQEASVSGDGPATTLNQSGEMQRMINWINTAYEEIQMMKPDWRFMTKSFSFVTIDSQASYVASVMGIPDLANWKEDSLRCYETTKGVSDEQWLCPLDYEHEFRDAREYGSTSEQEGRPTEFAVQPNNSIILYPIPDGATYTIRGQYYCAPDSLSGDSDTPIIPDRFHMAIVWRALMMYGMYESAQELIAHGERNFMQIYSKLLIDQSFKLKAFRALC